MAEFQGKRIYADTDLIINTSLPPVFFESPRPIRLSHDALSMCAEAGARIVISRLTEAELATALPNVLQRTAQAHNITGVSELVDFVNSQKTAWLDHMLDELHDDPGVVLVDNITINQSDADCRLDQMLRATKAVANPYVDDPDRKVRWTGVSDLIHLMTADSANADILLTLDKMIEHIKYGPKGGLEIVTLDAYDAQGSLEGLGRALEA